MQRSSGHSGSSVITPASTSRATSAPSSGIAGHRTLALPYRLLAQPSPENCRAHQATSSANGSNLVDADNGRQFFERLRDEAIVSVMLSLVPLKKPRAGIDAAKQARTLSKAVSHD